MKSQKAGENTVISSSDIYYDDCPICRAIRKAEEEGKDLSESELLEAFEKAKEKGGVVGKSKPLDVIQA